ncbi:MAG: hypothetical protein FJ104_09910, partial [Deltaproteobacteria bacterium]|nr:hypothetical protein [Deltaproteobacteria bacterium]
MSGRPGLKAVLALLAITGCSVRVATDLDGREAARVASVLGSEGVAADKVTEPGKGDVFAIEVS